jgi:hypothetical protein
LRKHQGPAQERRRTRIRVEVRKRNKKIKKIVSLNF